MSAHDELADSAARSRVGGRLDPSQSTGARSSDPDAAHGTAARARSGSGPHAQSLSTCRWPRGFNQTFIGNASPANGERARRSSMWCVSTHPHVRHVRWSANVGKHKLLHHVGRSCQGTSSHALCADTPSPSCASYCRPEGSRARRQVAAAGAKAWQTSAIAGPAATQHCPRREFVSTLKLLSVL